MGGHSARRRPSPPELASNTARWAVTMARWAISFATSGSRPDTKRVTRWQLVAFPGPNGGESRGIVDVLAVRKDHQPTSRVFERGDLLEMVLLQIKGGGARLPTGKDVDRLRAVQQYHRAKAVVLVRWKKGDGPRFFELANDRATGQAPWRPADPCKVFGHGKLNQTVSAV